MSEMTPEDPDTTAEIKPADQTAEIPTHLPAPLHQSAWLLFVTVAAAGLLVGIVVATLTGGAHGSVLAEATIGTSGGTLTFDKTGEVRIPPRALRAALHITIRRSVVDERLRVNPPNGPLYIFEPRSLRAYVLEPQSGRFLLPVTIVLPLSGANRNGEIFAYVNRTLLFFDGKVDPGAGTIAIEVFDFRFRAGRAPRADA